MSANLKILDSFINEFKDTYKEIEIIYDEGLLGDIKKIEDQLLNQKFFPSKQLESILQKQIRRARFPMEVAITGQFSAGKSTFLNALLSKNILPTGITPVTSKVNFINYGEEYKLKITYYSGAQEYAPIEAIADFTDQRSEDMKDIKYLTLYAPMDILKEISFVDTPGLNSQSQSDTDTTRSVLRDVGGIIWLTLIDNAGKQSEAKVLEEYMQLFKDKSLCVLNQKDKFSQEQVETTTKYVSEKFGKYFAQVTPISAKMALDARAVQKTVLIEDSIDSILKDFKKDLNANLNADTLDFFEEKYDAFQNKLKEIKYSDISSNLKLLQDSNIQEVLDFIENEMRPKAAESKEYAIKKDLKGICDILIKEYQTIIGVYDALCNVLKSCEEKVLKQFDEIHSKHSKELFTIYNSLESIMEKVANETYKNIQRRPAFRFEESSGGFLKSEKIQKIEFETYWINADNIYKNLFYDDQTIDKMFKRSIKLLKNVELNTDEAFREVYRHIKTEVQKWQEPYELIKKNREIGSDLEFANTRQFVAKVYENITLSYHSAILGNISALHKKFAFFYGAFSYSYTQITQECILLTKENIDKKIENYIDDSTRNTLSIPSSNDILETVKKNFKFDKMELFLASNRNYLYKTIDKSKKQFEEVNNEKVEYVVSQKELFLKKIEDIKTIKESLDTQEIEDKKESL